MVIPQSVSSSCHSSLSEYTCISILFITILALGVFIRFINLDHSVYWYDEVLTSLRIHGYTIKEVGPQVFNATVIDAADLQTYQTWNPTKGFNDTIQALVRNSEHTPLYYLMASGWTKLFGSSITAMRSLPALLSLLTLPATYWLSREVFKSSLTAWIALSLIAVSPLHVLYAQEARQYSLWFATAASSSAALLRALKKDNGLNWLLYVGFTTVNLYTHVLSILFLIPQVVFVIVIAGIQKFAFFKNSKITTSVTENHPGHERVGGWLSKIKDLIQDKTIQHYLLSLSTVGILFSPWAFIIVKNLQRLEVQFSWLNNSLDTKYLIISWIINFGRIFIDFGFTAYSSWAVFTTKFSLAHYILFVAIPIVLLFICSIIFSQKQLPSSPQVLLIIFITLPPIYLAFSDVLNSTIQSIQPRYFIPACLGIQLVIAYFLSQQISASTQWQQRIGKTIFCLLISGGILSCLLATQANSWWHRQYSADNPEIAQIINQSNTPLVISNDYYLNLAEVISLSYLVDPDTKFMLLAEPNVVVGRGECCQSLTIPDNFSDLFLFRPTTELITALQDDKGYEMEPVIESEQLWRIVPDTTK